MLKKPEELKSITKLRSSAVRGFKSHVLDTYPVL